MARVPNRSILEARTDNANRRLGDSELVKGTAIPPFRGPEKRLCRSLHPLAAERVIIELRRQRSPFRRKRRHVFPDRLPISGRRKKVFRRYDLLLANLRPDQVADLFDELGLNAFLRIPALTRYLFLGLISAAVAVDEHDHGRIGFVFPERRFQQLADAARAISGHDDDVVQIEQRMNIRPIRENPHQLADRY